MANIALVKREFLRAALRLRNAGPTQWNEFIQQFGNYSDMITDSILEADVGSILVAQGCAKQCRALVQMLAEVEHLPDKL